MPLLHTTLLLLITTLRQRTSTVRASTKRPNSTRRPRTSIASRLISTRLKLTSIPVNEAIEDARILLRVAVVLFVVSPVAGFIGGAKGRQVSPLFPKQRS